MLVTICPHSAASRVTAALLILGVMSACTPALATGRRVGERGGQQYLAGRLIVKLAPSCRGLVDSRQVREEDRFGVPALDEQCRQLGVDSIWPLYVGRVSGPALKHGCDLAYALRYTGGEDEFAAATAFGALPEVAWAGPEILMHTCDVPNDPFYGQQWHLPKIGGPVAWDWAHGDTSVVIGLVDNGFEWHHPDLEGNIAINRAEDINHNGRFDSLPWPAGDVDGIDQDSNGYADDVAGYNMMENSPNPAPESTTTTDWHGTHTWGIADAIANNATGVAGVCWNCRAIGVRAGTGALMAPSAVISGIYYLVARGAKVVSLSFGSTSPNQPVADACDFAWDSGCLVVAGAGNNGDSLRFYPAANDHVVSVAASDQNDGKPYWSNFGTWIDVTAPGNAIVSTIIGHWYGIMSGTSMATPVVAGALAWTWSVFPGRTNAEIESTLYAACEPMPDTLYAQGLMGHGRISLSRVVLPLQYSDLQVTNWRVNDAAGNGNGRLDPGETASLIVTYSNPPGWRDASGIAALLSCNAAGVTVERAMAHFPDIPAGDSGTCSADSFVIAIGDSVPPQMLDLRLHVAAAPAVYRPDTTVVAQCGSPRVLIVDDDNGAAYERYYTAACDSNGVLYRLYDRAAQGPLEAETLRQYPVVIWFCGDDSVTTLAPEDRSPLASFLRAGGNLFLSGQGIARDLANRGSSFLPDYLHAEFAIDSVGQPYLVGRTDDPLTLGDTMVVAGSGGAGNGNSLDGIRPVGGALACAGYEGYGDTTVCSMIRFADAYRVAFMSVPFEAVDHSASLYLQRWTLMRRVLQWLGELMPGVGIEERASGHDPNPPGTRSSTIGLATPSLLRSGSRAGFVAPFSGPAVLRAYSCDGRRAAEWRCELETGRRFEFDPGAAGLGNGVYLFTLAGAGGNLVQKVTLVR